VLKDHAGDAGADPNGNFVISSKVNVLEVVDGAPISATITLDAKDGRFITRTPIIRKWDRIYIEITDTFGKKFKTVVHVKKRKKIRSRGKGLQLKLICPHQSSNILTRTVSKPNIRSSGHEALTDIMNQLNSPVNRGSKDPEIILTSPFDITNKFGNRLSRATSNNYIFEAVKAEAAIDEIIRREGDVVANGGAFEFHYFRFQSLYNHSTGADLDKVALQVFEQGYKQNGASFTNVPSVTIKKKPYTLAPTNYIETDSNIETELGTNLIAIGHKSAGSYPKNYSIYQGEKDAFRLAKNWDGNLIFYKQGMRVRHLGIFYKAQIDHTSSPGNPPNTTPTLWAADNTFVPSVQYSPLTKSKAQYWINAAGGWIHAALATNSKPAVVDHNIIIKDSRHNRTWVDLAETNSANLTTKNVLNSGQPFDGLRVLCNGTGVGDFAGNDPNGVAKSNNLLEYRGIPGQGGAWYVYRVSQQDDEVYSFREGESWVYRPCQGATSFVDGSGVCQLGTRGSGWVKGAYVVIDINGVALGRFTADAQFDCVHPIKRNSSTNVIELGNEKITPDDTDSNSAVFANFDVGTGPLNFFGGLNFAFPWPRNTNSIPYGTVSLGEQIKLFVFDILNMHQDHTGGREWFGPNVEDYFPIQGFAFFEKFQDLLGGGLLRPGGDYKMNLWLADRSDNVVLIEYTHSHNDVTSPQEAAVAKARIFRGRPGISNWLPVKEIEVLDIFDWRNIIRGGIETADSFDSEGRFRYGFPIPLTPFYTNDSKFHNSEKIHISIDAFRGVKPLVATNVDNPSSKPERNIEPQKIKAEHIVSYHQLKNLVKSSEKIFNFEREEYDVKTTGRCDIAFGDPVYYNDPEIIDITTDGFTNTVKVVANSIIYSISKTAKGPGGFIRSLNLITRIWP
jgi:hypothetical protein